MIERKQQPAFVVHRIQASESVRTRAGSNCGKREEREQQQREEDDDDDEIENENADGEGVGNVYDSNIATGVYVECSRTRCCRTSCLCDHVTKLWTSLLVLSVMQFILLVLLAPLS